MTASVLWQPYLYKASKRGTPSPQHLGSRGRSNTTSYTMHLLSLASALLLLVGIAHANRFCMQDSDCDALGGLYCIKSACDFGICACPRGKAARYVGSEQLFQCVSLKKVGEGCDTEGTGGICAAMDSYCDDGKCVCPTGKESRWGGEACIDIQTDLYPSESHSTSGIGSCVTSDLSGQTTVTGQSGMEWESTIEDANPGTVANWLWDGVPNVCACDTGYRTTLPNDFDSAPYMGRKAPYCTPIAIGDTCITDFDCVNIQENFNGAYTSGGGTCNSNNVCECSDSTYVPDITGLYCNTGLSYGVSCAWTGYESGKVDVGVCNGNIGLRCGDICDPTEWLSITSFNHTCVCDPSYVDNSGSCGLATYGTSCKGDFNCKSISDNAICDNGQCKDSAALLAASILSFIFPFIVIHLHL